MCLNVIVSYRTESSFSTRKSSTVSVSHLSILCVCVCVCVCACACVCTCMQVECADRRNTLNNTGVVNYGATCHVRPCQFMLQT